MRQASKNHAMDMWDLKKWRRKLKYSQFEAADRLGVSRAAIQHWECEHSPIRHAVGLACEEITRRWKQRPSFGPVVLTYTDEPTWPETDYPSRALCMQCELQPNNEAAIRRASRLRETPDFTNPAIIDENGGVVWSAPELLLECEKRQEQGKGKAAETTGGPSADGKATFEDNRSD
jgi:transcriptional regulator with XRE-family HTH domain